MQLMRFLVVGVLCGVCGESVAEAPNLSLRPPVTLTGPVSVLETKAVLRPKARPAGDAEVIKASMQDGQAKPGFQLWLTGFRSRALAQGIEGPVLDLALSDIRYDEEIIKRDRNQSEFTKTIWDYLSTAVSDTRIANGRAALARHGEALRQIEEKFGVDHQVLLAIWGLESAYGTFKGREPVIQSLATLAYDGRRAEFFEAQLIAALQILQAGDVRSSAMTGSWAGAMGHTQFMPTSFLDHAVDFTGDGRRDIWDEDPRDALASTAAYLKHFGWKKGQPWGVEVQLPKDFDYALADRKIRKSPREWARYGVHDMSGRAVADHGEASILLPAGSKGAAFMIFDNFAVIERYNPADAYVIGVGHLGDRILKRPGIRGGWPEGDRALTFDERIELQERLTRAGFDTKKIDGRIGPLTIAAVRGWQKSTGEVPDGYASLALLNKLR